ncbi:MAG TPA: HEAT repeat domain-containing protein, partial [Ktedonobacterales bacterium]|nr:HEAT repeat domain-containing protein [Ktedonobacterales bacterium]
VGLVVLGRRAPARLVKRISHTDDAHDLFDLVYVLQRVGDGPAVRHAILAYGSVNPTEWRRAAEDAAREVDNSAVALLIEGSQAANDIVRQSAAEALGSIGGNASLNALLTLLGDANWAIRLAAVASLTRSGAGELDTLHEALSGGSRRVRAGVANVLSVLRQPASVKPLMQALGDSGRLVRANAAEALGRIGDPQAVEALVGALQDADRGVRNSAAGALRTIRTKAAADAVTAWDRSRRSARDTFSASNDGPRGTG